MYPIKGFVAKALPVNFFRLFPDHVFAVVGQSPVALVSSAAPKKKAFDRGGPVWPPRSNVANDRLRGGLGGLRPPSQNFSKKEKINVFWNPPFPIHLFGRGDDLICLK